MITTNLLKGVMAEARPIIERMLDDAEVIAGFRDVIAENGGDWSSLKALIKAQIQDERDDAGDGKRVRKILDRADYSAAYADMLGLGKMNELKNISADPPHDPETGEIIEQPESRSGANVQRQGMTSGGKPAQNAPRPSKRAVSTNDEPSPEAGPQAEASHVGTDSGTPADREGHISEGAAHTDEAVTVDRHVSAAPPPDDDLELPACLDRREKVLELA